MPKSKLNESGVALISNPMRKREGAGSNYTAPTTKPRAQRSLNCAVVERKDSHLSSDHTERQHYAKQMTELVGDTKVPAVQYKGAVVPRRVLSDYSYLTN